MIFKLCEDRVLVRRDDPIEKIGRLHVPNVAQTIPQLATVISVGPGRKLENGEMIVPRFSPGDRVVIGKYSGTDIEELIKGESLCLMRAEEILMIVENENVEGLEIVGEGAERVTGPTFSAEMEEIIDKETDKINSTKRPDSSAGEQTEETETPAGQGNSVNDGGAPEKPDPKT